jgi:gas vesicle protein
MELKNDKQMNNTAKVILGVAAGAAAGAITGILLAPDSGKNTRKKIAQGTTDLVDDLKQEVSDKVDFAKETYNESLEKAANSSKNGIDRAKEKLSMA